MSPPVYYRIGIKGYRVLGSEHQGQLIVHLDCPAVLGIDEHTLHKGQRFAATFADSAGRRPVGPVVKFDPDRLWSKFEGTSFYNFSLPQQDLPACTVKLLSLT